MFPRAASVAARTGDVKRTGTLRWDELALAGLPMEGSTISTTKSGNYPRSELQLDQSFWRVVGLYLAEAAPAYWRSSGGRSIRIARTSGR